MLHMLVACTGYVKVKIWIFIAAWRGKRNSNAANLFYTVEFELTININNDTPSEREKERAEKIKIGLEVKEEWIFFGTKTVKILKK